jgi:septal ring factor EnvC (AmiA/AmiB activator)
MENNPPASEEKPVEEANQTGENPAPAVDTPEKETPAAVTPAAEPEKPAKKPWLSRALYATFSPETRLGRFMRPFLRWTAAIAGLFALGMLATYLLLYAPATQQLAAVQADLQSVQQQAAKTSSSLAAAQTSLADLQTRYDQSQAALKKAEMRVSLLQVANQVAAARLALDNRDGAAAQKALADARTILNQVLPDVKSIDANAATQLDSRLTLVVSELNDPTTAQADLVILATKLSTLDSALK